MAPAADGKRSRSSAGPRISAEAGSRLTQSLALVAAGYVHLDQHDGAAAQQCAGRASAALDGLDLQGHALPAPACCSLRQCACAATSVVRSPNWRLRWRVASTSAALPQTASAGAPLRDPARIGPRRRRGQGRPRGRRSAERGHPLAGACAAGAGVSGPRRRPTGAGPRPLPCGFVGRRGHRSTV